MRLFAASVFVALSLSGCTSTDEEPVGNPATFDRINGLTSCAFLQAEFDQFDIAHGDAAPGSDNALAATAYMTATDARMEAVGCYD